MNATVGLHRSAGTMASDGWALLLTPESAGWTYTSLRILELEPDGVVTHHTGLDELIVLPLSGGCTVDVGEERFELTGRSDVFAGVTDFAYAPHQSTLTIRSRSGGRFALPGARARRTLPARYQAADAIPIELRGAGACSRQIVNFCTPDSFEADRLIAVEAYTPSGNWSTFPPHKHDTDGDDETALEEIYYYEIADGPRGPGHAYQRVYGTDDRPIEVLAEVGTGDVVLVPHGWHGPSMAVPGYHAYFLNVMAGPADERAWRVREDPRHSWVRDTWTDAPVDPRLPLPGFDTGAVSTDSNWGRA